MENVAGTYTEVNAKYTDILSEFRQMSDKKLVELVQTKATKFASEMRPLFILVEERFKRSVHIKHKPFLSKYTNWDNFCEEVLNFTGRHVRRIIAGEAMPKSKEPGSGEASGNKKTKLKESVLYTDHDYIHKAHEFLKKLLKPLELDPERHRKVARAIAEEILGDLGEHAKSNILGFVFDKEQLRKEREGENPVEGGA